MITCDFIILNNIDTGTDRVTVNVCSLVIDTAWVSLLYTPGVSDDGKIMLKVLQKRHYNNIIITCKSIFNMYKTHVKLQPAEGLLRKT